MRGKIYTLEELDRALPLVRAIVGDVMETYGQLRDLLEGLGLSGRSHAIRPDEVLFDLPPDVRDLVERIRDYVRELGELGLYLRDPSTGLVEAYGEQGEDIVYFSWKHGEQRVRFYHGLFGSHRERKPVLLSV
jgi:hypothetical protein